MPRLTDLAHAAVRDVLATGETAIDATAGNGHDTRFLSELVDPEGRVFAFDIQPEALAHTAAIANARNVTLLARDHSELRDAIPQEFHGKIGAVMFNLGYLPGSDHSLTTQTTSTLKAISAALELLRPGGVLTVLAYSGHPGGAEETEAAARFLSELPAEFVACEVGSNDSDEKTPSSATSRATWRPLLHGGGGEVGDMAETMSDTHEAASPTSPPPPWGRGRRTALGPAGEGEFSSIPNTFSRPSPRLFVVHKQFVVG